MTDPQPSLDPRSGRTAAMYDDLAPEIGETSFLDDVTTVEERVETGPSVVGRLGLVVAALAVAGSGAFAVTRALSEPAGPQSPDEAVEQFFRAVDSDDLVGLTEVLLPSERESLIDPMVDLFSELERLQLIDGNIDLESSDVIDVGLDFSVEGLEYTTSPVGQGVVDVDVIGGVVTVTGTVGDLPFGARIEDELVIEDRQEVIDEDVADFAADGGTSFTVVEEGGAWYVSLWYSVAEEARAAAGLAAPAFGAGVSPMGASTPEGAVRSLLDRAVDLDAEGVIATLDPREFRALYDYAPLFLDDAERGVAELRTAATDEGVTWGLDRLDLAAVDARDRTVVRIEGFAFSAESNGDAMSVDFDGDCVTTVVDGQIDEICLDEAIDELVEAGVPDAYLDFAADYQSGVTVVERDNGWFVSGMPTILGVYNDLLAALEPEDIEGITSFFEDALDGALAFIDPLATPFGPGDPFVIEVDPLVEDEHVDPFVDDDAVDEYVPPDLDPSSVDTFLPGLELSGGSPEDAYFAFATGLEATWYTYGYSFDTGASLEIVAFDVRPADLVAAMDRADPYVRIEVEGLPDEAVAYEWPEVDRVVAVDNYLVSAYYAFEENQAILLEQVNHIADR